VETEVCALLAGGDEEVNQAVTLIDRHLRGRLCRWLHRRCPGLSADDLDDAWSEALLGVLRAARRRYFRPDRPLFGWLCHIVGARGTDALRKHTVRAAVLTPLRPGCHDVPARGPSVFAQVSGGEIRALLHDAIARLPPQQRLVLHVFVSQYPATARASVLREQASLLAGAVLTESAVRRALDEERRKLRALFLRCGYAPPRAACA
jgi:DNA-directed RNA polymerase specialized sigma24 family protein